MWLPPKSYSRIVINKMNVHTKYRHRYKNQPSFFQRSPLPYCYIPPIDVIEEWCCGEFKIEIRTIKSEKNPISE